MVQRGLGALFLKVTGHKEGSDWRMWKGSPSNWCVTCPDVCVCKERDIYWKQECLAWSGVPKSLWDEVNVIWCFCDHGFLSGSELYPSHKDVFRGGLAAKSFQLCSVSAQTCLFEMKPKQSWGSLCTSGFPVTEDKAFLSDTNLKVPVFIPYQGVTKNKEFIFIYLFFGEKAAAKKQTKKQILWEILWD